jgi:hypothetical protein
VLFSLTQYLSRLSSIITLFTFYLSNTNKQTVIEGQGTVALELLDEVPSLEAIIAPVGGGGLVTNETFVFSILHFVNFFCN